MTLGLHDPHDRRRRQVRRTVIRWLLGIGVIVAAGVATYQTGASLAEREIAELTLTLAKLDERVQALERENTELQAGLILSARRLKDADLAYRRDVPEGEVAVLMGRVREKLAAGIDQKRLAFLIDSAGKARKCDNKPVTKRFVVRTPISRGANDSVSFAKNAITITALGDSARNQEGKVEAWFDPARAVTLRLVQLGGKTTVRKGKLPIHTSVVVKDREYLYSVVEGTQRGFVEITGDRCDYP
jgi:cell division protein FtsB